MMSRIAFRSALGASLFIGIVTGAVHAQVADPREFFPLQIGNRWEYIEFEFRDKISFAVRVFGDTVNASGDTLIGCVEKSIRSTYSTISWYHIDSLYNVYSLFGVNDKMGDAFLAYKLNAPVGKWWHPRNNDLLRAEVIERDSMLDHGIRRHRMMVEYYYPGYDDRSGDSLRREASRHSLTTGIGLVSMDHEPFNLDNALYLTGAIINGKQYGKLTSDIPSASTRTSALDCMPNPCAGSSIISYSLLVPGPVHLVVSDMLGREVAVLVDACQEAGEHRVRFDGAGLPSGSYLVTCSAGDVRTCRALRMDR